VEEYERLRKVAALLDAEEGADGTAGRATPRRALRTRPAARGSRELRADEAMRLVRDRPGITVAQIAEAMDIGTTYLYRLLPRLEREGRIRKEGRGYRLA
jgi:hypothetical protein